MKILETERLVLNQFTLNDAEFILELVNDPAFLRFIGDKGVRNVADAREYLSNGPIASYERHGFGLYAMQLKPSGSAIGMCGLLRRESLDAPDIGFALLPDYRRQGYTFEAAAAVLAHGKEAHGLGRIVAITTPDNGGSIGLLEKLGLEFEGMVELNENDPACKLFAIAL